MLSRVTTLSKKFLQNRVGLTADRVVISHSIQCLSGCTCRTASSLAASLWKTRIRWRGFRGGPWRWLKDWKACTVEKDWGSVLLLERAQGDLITLFEYLNGSYREDRGSLFTKKTHNEKTRGYSYTLLRARFHLNTRKICWWCFFGLV